MKRVVSAINLLEKGHISTFVRADGLFVDCVRLYSVEELYHWLKYVDLNL